MFNPKLHTKSYLVSHPDIALEIVNSIKITMDGFVQVNADEWCTAEVFQDLDVLALCNGNVALALAQNSPRWRLLPAAYSEDVCGLADYGVAVAMAFNCDEWGASDVAQHDEVLSGCDGLVLYFLAKKSPTWILSPKAQDFDTLTKQVSMPHQLKNSVAMTIIKSNRNASKWLETPVAQSLELITHNNCEMLQYLNSLYESIPSRDWFKTQVAHDIALLDAIGQPNKFESVSLRRDMVTKLEWAQGLRLAHAPFVRRLAEWDRTYGYVVMDYLRDNPMFKAGTLEFSSCPTLKFIFTMLNMGLGDVLKSEDFKYFDQSDVNVICQHANASIEECDTPTQKALCIAKFLYGLECINAIDSDIEIEQVTSTYERWLNDLVCDNEMSLSEIELSDCAPARERVSKLLSSLLIDTLSDEMRGTYGQSSCVVIY